MVEAALSGRLDRALVMLDGLHAEDAALPLLAWGLADALRRLLRAIEARESGQPPRGGVAGSRHLRPPRAGVPPALATLHASRPSPACGWWPDSIEWQRAWSPARSPAIRRSTAERIADVQSRRRPRSSAVIDAGRRRPTSRLPTPAGDNPAPMNPIDPAVTIADLGRRARAASAGYRPLDHRPAQPGAGGDRRRARGRPRSADRRQRPRPRVGTRAGLDAAFVDRLAFDEAAVAADGARRRAVAALADPIGAITDLRYQPSGIQVGRMRVPLGVIGIIYESRPNVTIDAAVLCIKSGNATILRGGSEAIHSNRALAERIRAGLAQAGLPEDAVQLVGTTDRAAVGP